jgi:hypothetical protein
LGRLAWNLAYDAGWDLEETETAGVILRPRLFGDKFRNPHLAGRKVRTQGLRFKPAILVLRNVLPKQLPRSGRRQLEGVKNSAPPFCKGLSLQRMLPVRDAGLLLRGVRHRLRGTSRALRRRSLRR